MYAVAMPIKYESSHEASACAADYADRIVRIRSQDGAHQLHRCAGDYNDLIASISIRREGIHTLRPEPGT